jgi:type VI secretion system secreted protein Hcp
MPGSIPGYFLKIDGIAGESTDRAHKEQIELVSFSWGLTRQALHSLEGGLHSLEGRHGGAGKVQLKEFQFQMRVNKASPAIFLACASGKHIKEATLSVSRSGKAAFDWLKVKFRDILVTSYEQAGDQEDPPHELVAFDFAQVELQYSRRARGAAETAGWDLSRNVKI